MERSTECAGERRQRRVKLVERPKVKLAPSGSHFQTFECQSSRLHSELSDVLSGSFRDQYLLSSLLSKLGTTAVTPEERERVAIEGWYADELFNSRTDVRLQCFERGLFHDKHVLGVPVRLLLSEAAALISDLLPAWSHHFYERSSFTNGAAVGYGKKVGDPWYKYDGRLTATPLAMSRVISLVRATPLWNQHLSLRFGCPEKAVRMVPGELGFTVPKNASTDRFCSKQPTGNMLLQKAIGSVIRESLRKVGINLNDQSKNRNAARRASITQRDATIDLKSASNSVVRRLVGLLMPSDWLREIEACRSPLCSPSNGAPYQRTVMVGAMGNGFTFELESLIFWALAEACRLLTRTRGRTLVYGDDLITPVACVHHVMALYGFCGFRINRSKSFWTGDFRESCGGHYKAGVDVTPIYIRKPIDNTSRMIWFLNKLRFWAAGTFDGGYGLCDDRLWPMYKRLRRKYVSAQLWGGVRSSSNTSLWSPQAPRDRLMYPVVSKPLIGRPAVLRTFQYMSPYSTSEHSRLISHIATGAARRLMSNGLLDLQVYFDVFGEVPISTSMSRLMSVDETPSGIGPNTEQFGEPCPVFPAEVVSLAESAS